jgi:hypothetical protein
MVVAEITKHQLFESQPGGVNNGSWHNSHVFCLKYVQSELRSFPNIVNAVL